MQRIGIIVIVFAAAVSVSIGISFLLWGQQGANSHNTGDSELDQLRTRIARIEAVIASQAKLFPQQVPSSHPEFEETDALLARLDALERKVNKLPSLDLTSPDQSDSEVGEFFTRAAEEKAREVYQQMKEQERREQEEERQRRREERWERTRERLTDTYNERLVLLTKELSLTPNQETDVREAINVRKESVLKVYANWYRPREERTDDVPSWDEINKAFDTSIKQILDAQQYRTYKKKHLDDFNRGRPGRRRRGR